MLKGNSKNFGWDDLERMILLCFSYKSANILIHHFSFYSSGFLLNLGCVSEDFSSLAQNPSVQNQHLEYAIKNTVAPHLKKLAQV